MEKRTDWLSGPSDSDDEGALLRRQFRVINVEYRATPLLATMRERFNLGAPFTAR